MCWLVVCLSGATPCAGVGAACVIAIRLRPNSSYMTDDSLRGSVCRLRSRQVPRMPLGLHMRTSLDGGRVGLAEYRSLRNARYIVHQAQARVHIAI